MSVTNSNQEISTASISRNESLRIRLSLSSEPDSAYVAITTDDAELEQLFKVLTRNITNPASDNIVIDDTISNCFRITA